MLRFSASQLRAAVSAICPDVQARVALLGYPRLNNESLWHELSCCLLSSQVPYPLAQAAAGMISRADILTTSSLQNYSKIQAKVQDILSGHFLVGSSWRRFRFPVSKSKQLASTWVVINTQAGSLSAALKMFDNVDDLRGWLVKHAPGIGPKQASMFLRNVGISYNLAILDRHVLNYMGALGLVQNNSYHISSLIAYRTKEAILQHHATDIGYPVGVLDWAIWIVMRAANAHGKLERDQ